ncbi:sugar phosphate isomerase/epimerase family protein [Halobacillus yeomjeoni]|uniref:Sugar phosphate isomerase/epimerase n=1 Tax=Halobacillus yeomjeoni TaxID=311194 RepID=A0A931MV38_9BACI|nr:sugar phosphate isomerase/epimerase [Halobacillus yeomjeoni]MBH0230623.1 sugar phosphate isomerase/epimerase [Halobacillus yeomjeoni]
MVSIPIAAQMFTLRKESEQDFEGTLREVAKLGFDGVEFAGFGGLEAEEVKRLIDELELKAVSCHIPLETLKTDLKQVLVDLKTLDCSYVVCPYIENREEADYMNLIADLNDIGDECRKEGITLCYHNHDFELERLNDGRTALETIYDETEANTVMAEFDVYWLKKAGEHPDDWIERYAGRTPLLHLKDMTNDEEGFFAELGTGGVDIPSILQTGKDAGVKWWIIEQDQCRQSPLKSLETSINYLRQY